VSVTGKYRLTGVRKLAVLLLPWAFLALFAALYVTILWPQARGGHFLAMCVGLFAALVFISFAAAALTFSRDVLIGRYP
jgi:hypothetical protein